MSDLESEIGCHENRLRNHSSLRTNCLISYTHHQPEAELSDHGESQQINLLPSDMLRNETSHQLPHSSNKSADFENPYLDQSNHIFGHIYYCVAIVLLSLLSGGTTDVSVVEDEN